MIAFPSYGAPLKTRKSSFYIWCPMCKARWHVDNFGFILVPPTSIQGMRIENGTKSSIFSNMSRPIVEKEPVESYLLPLRPIISNYSETPTATESATESATETLSSSRPASVSFTTKSFQDGQIRPLASIVNYASCPFKANLFMQLIWVSYII
eukprot:NODE_625_length_5889_cov_0.576339.p4 type:complete len:153 gc:universal NODE_625_length_5889_cov_0.576339:5815-5357(-)